MNCTVLHTTAIAHHRSLMTSSMDNLTNAIMMVLYDVMQSGKPIRMAN